MNEYFKTLKLVIRIFVIQHKQSSRNPTGPKTEASESEEVGPVKIENQEARLAFGFYQTFYDIL
jgi:hypothetical protein